MESGEWRVAVCMAEAVVGNVRVMVGQWSNCPRGSELEVRQDDVWWWLVVEVVGSRSTPYENCMGYVSLKAGGERKSAGELRRRKPHAKKKRGLKGWLAGWAWAWAWAWAEKRKREKEISRVNRAGKSRVFFSFSLFLFSWEEPRTLGKSGH